MILPGMAIDEETLVKPDGARIEGLKAIVSMRRVVTFHTDIDIEPKDILLKKCADEGQEAFLVLDPKLHRAEDGIPENYQIAVRRVEVPE